jgi:hypothetical protein
MSRCTASESFLHQGEEVAAACRISGSASKLNLISAKTAIYQSAFFVAGTGQRTILANIGIAPNCWLTVANSPPDSSARQTYPCSHEWTAFGGVSTGTVAAGFFLNSAKLWTKT